MRPIGGWLADKFGDNGLVSVLMGRIDGTSLDVDTWLMSCRVLKRGMEQAMFDALVEECRSRGISRIIGTYIPTAKNHMVADHYERLGFQLLCADQPGAVQWIYRIPNDYTPLNYLIDNANSYARAHTAT
jgi:predicted enzyme involved in methoxymalonyl-ACP biosynthesis